MEDLVKELNNLQLSNNITGIIYDNDTLLHKSLHEHPEVPERVSCIINHLAKNDILNHKNVQVIEKIEKVQRQDLLLVHNEAQINSVDKIFQNNAEYEDIYHNEHTTNSAYLAAGGAITAIDKVMRNEWQNAFVCIRPPGHHAGFLDVPSGFCFFNNIALAAKYAQFKYSAKKILILDWDVHHGNGTQVLLENDPNILFISLHRFDDGVFYPFKVGSNKQIAKTKGMKLNIPWNTQIDISPGDDEYIYAFEKLVLPILKQYQPDLVLISCGFDAAIDDPLGGCSVSRDGYAYMTNRIIQYSKNQKVIVMLEGGYNLNSLQVSSESVVRVLLGEQLPLINSINKRNIKEMIEMCQPNQLNFKDVQTCFDLFCKYWKIQDQTSEIDHFVNRNNLKKFNFIPKNFILSESKLFKPIPSKKEVDFYNLQVQNELELKDIVPEFLEYDKTNNQIIFTNFLYEKQSSSILKLKFDQDRFMLCFIVRNKKRDILLFEDTPKINLSDSKIQEMINLMFKTKKLKKELLEILTQIQKFFSSQTKYSYTQPEIIIVNDHERMFYKLLNMHQRTEAVGGDYPILGLNNFIKVIAESENKK